MPSHLSHLYIRDIGGVLTVPRLVLPPLFGLALSNLVLGYVAAEAKEVSRVFLVEAIQHILLPLHFNCRYSLARAGITDVTLAGFLSILDTTGAKPMNADKLLKVQSLGMFLIFARLVEARLGWDGRVPNEGSAWLLGKVLVNCSFLG